MNAEELQKTKVFLFSCLAMASATFASTFFYIHIPLPEYLGWSLALVVVVSFTAMLKIGWSDKKTLKKLCIASAKFLVGFGVGLRVLYWMGHRWMTDYDFLLLSGAIMGVFLFSAVEAVVRNHSPKR
ncbi:MAG: hypothetical protein HYT22_00190 [Candidatus Niyogibacteria bacterium]|nr:hypothetical protein [Candidatus Niyogibacteria bacterium]